MHAEIIKQLGFPPLGKDAASLTDNEKLALYVAAGFPLETYARTDPNGVYMVTVKSAMPFGVTYDGERFTVVVNPHATD